MKKIKPIIQEVFEIITLLLSAVIFYKYNPMSFITNSINWTISDNLKWIIEFVLLQLLVKLFFRFLSHFLIKLKEKFTLNIKVTLESEIEKSHTLILNKKNNSVITFNIIIDVKGLKKISQNTEIQIHFPEWIEFQISDSLYIDEKMNSITIKVDDMLTNQKIVDLSKTIKVTAYLDSERTEVNDYYKIIPEIYNKNILLNKFFIHEKKNIATIKTT